MVKNKITEELLTEKLIEQNQKERQAELEKLKKINIEDPLFTPLKNMLGDRAVASQNDFAEEGKKATGLSAGYIAQDNTGNTFILKHFYKTHAACLAETLTDEERKEANNQRLNDKQKNFIIDFKREALTESEMQRLTVEEQYALIKKRRQAIIDRRDGVQELIGSTMYQLLLHDRAPKEGLVKADAQYPDSLYVRSKFCDNAVTLSEFSGFSGKTRVKADDQKLKNLEGFEKTIAACHMLGEGDYHAGNLMVQDGETVIKIDHGKSFTTFHKDFETMIRSTIKTFVHPDINYYAAIKAGNLSFSIEKYSEALNQMISQFDEQQMEAIVDQKIDELKRAGFDPGNVVLSTNIKNFDDLRKHYKDCIKENLVNIQEVAKEAEIVAKFSNVLPEFKNGRWLGALNDSFEKNPVLCAIYNNIKIEGKNAKEWAYENNYKIKVPIDFKEEIVKEQQWKKDPQGKWQEEEVRVKKDKVEEGLFDPAKSLHIQDKDIGEKLESLFFDFAKQAATKNIINKEVKTFLNNIIKQLKKENYLTEHDIEGIKKYLKHKDNIKNMTNMLNAKSFKLNSQDTTYYKVGNFCEKINLHNVSNYFMKKISPENLNKIHNAEKLIADSIQIGNILQQQKQEGFQTKRIGAVKEAILYKLQARKENQQQR